MTLGVTFGNAPLLVDWRYTSMVQNEGLIDPVSSYASGMESPAERWYRMAAERGHEAAKQRLEELEREH